LVGLIVRKCIWPAKTPLPALEVDFLMDNVGDSPSCDEKLDG